MKYYVTTDVHSFYSQLRESLTAAGYFDDTEPHKLIICGDLLDRGEEAIAMQDFVLDLMEKDEIILVQGNHEDLMLQLLNNWHRGSYNQWNHVVNGTLDTVCQLTGCGTNGMFKEPTMTGRALLHTPFIQKIIPSMIDYYETKHYIFVHGWIPCAPTLDEDGLSETQYEFHPDWRDSDAEQWKKARWVNGMAAAHEGCTEEGKTIVCGHWHTSFGHANYEDNGGEFDNNPDFSPYMAKGIIALDACTASSGKVNCIVIEDEDL